MFFHEKSYDIDELMRHNMHIHTTFSGCAKPEMTLNDIVRTAEGLDAAVLFQDLKRFGGMGHKNIFCKTNDYEGAMRDTAKWKSVKGYIVWDEPIFEEHLAETRRMIDYCEREYPDVKFGKINVDNEPDLTALFKVQSIPYIALVKNNTFVDFSVGYVPKATLARLIEENK